MSTATSTDRHFPDRRLPPAAGIGPSHAPATTCTAQTGQHRLSLAGDARSKAADPILVVCVRDGFEGRSSHILFGVRGVRGSVRHQHGEAVSIHHRCPSYDTLHIEVELGQPVHHGRSHRRIRVWRLCHPVRRFVQLFYLFIYLIAYQLRGDQGTFPQLLKAYIRCSPFNFHSPTHPQTDIVSLNCRGMVMAPLPVMSSFTLQITTGLRNKLRLRSSI